MIPFTNCKSLNSFSASARNNHQIISRKIKKTNLNFKNKIKTQEEKRE